MTDYCTPADSVRTSDWRALRQPLQVDPKRLGTIFITGAMVEAQYEGRAMTCDLGALDELSLRIALTRMGEHGVQDLVASLLGHPKSDK